ncbi:hypothetical protein [Halobellus sp. Atlit-38R]|uniref:hypothetical protein n=1 Tax=Halobellus sp. Atlit-38R TaxID=2282131 RepID=UPI0011C43070|nr:hypothetical protein [Halobellus sp. Atlit-38R]
MSPGQTSRKQPAADQARSDVSPPNSAGANTTETDPRLLNTEDIHIRSYGQHTASDLAVEVTTASGDVVFESQYTIKPGAMKSEVNTLPPGKYTVRAALNSECQETCCCHIDAAPDHTAVIEIGNGVLSLTEGLPI